MRDADEPSKPPFPPRAGAARIVGVDLPAGFGAGRGWDGRIVLDTVDREPVEADPGRLVGADIVLWRGGCASEAAATAIVDRAAAGVYRLVIAVDMPRLDDWTFALGTRGVELIVDGDEDAVMRAVGLMLADEPAGVAETGDAVRRLSELGDEVARIAAALAKTAPGQVPLGVQDRSLAYRGEGAPRVTAAAVRAMIRARRARDRHFPGLFSDPAWDILLDLYAARLEGCPVAVSSLCIAAAVPPTTALRWIAGMTEQGLLRREADATDRRRVFIALADGAVPRVEACIAAVLAGGAAVA